MSDFFPRDLLIDILTRLPIETLVRCTLVSKPWFSLITSSNFISLHLNRTIANLNDSNGRLLVRHCTEKPTKKEHYSLHFDGNGTFDEYKKLKFPFTCLNSYLGIVGSCNGLICISDDQFGYTDLMFLWNPSIRKSVPLPKPNVTYNTHGSFMHSLGFGFDSISNDFKVVRIVHTGWGCDKIPPYVEVYTLKTGVWRDISDKAPSYLVWERSRQAYVNGAAHWVAFTAREDKLASRSKLILSFNMNDELFGEIWLPDSVANADNFMQRLRLVVFKESLSVFEHFPFHDDPHCSIWTMNEYGVAASWTKLVKIDLRGCLRTPLGLRKNGEVLLASTDGHLVSYDIESRRIMYLGICDTIVSHYDHSFYVDTYMESLVLLDKGVDFCDVVVSDLHCMKKKRRD